MIMRDILEAKRNSLVVCALLHRIGILGTGLEETKEGETEKKGCRYRIFIYYAGQGKRSGRCYVNEVVGRLRGQ